MKKTYPKAVYLNGEWMESEKASVSVFDRGFLFGDGVYEVIPVYEGKFFLLEEHLDRLKYGLNETRIGFEVSAVENVLKTAVEKAELTHRDGTVYMQVTRGIAPRSHFFPADAEPTILIYASPLVMKGFENKLVKVLISEDFRWHRCDIKSTSLMANVGLNNDAYSQGFYENVLQRDGLFTEGSHTSVFFVKDNIVYTHPKGHHILPGITRKAVIELCEELGIEVREKALHIDDTAHVDEVFIAGTTVQITAVGEMMMDGVLKFRKEGAGTITKKLQQQFIKRTGSL
ncbi:aminotransferase class IV [Sinomicrobium weinanense]|uniref:Aminotransferase class IV n=1 Tax=Sinomicrobium weinanense TaxID=2842200 RepID=A0A926PZX7_9FLAO|nr:aminotransferase class IV [Sinomicrobium weinanense]MBC9794497.1 aminotransferase class IV [Sinomicrobium weinanense]MBU3124404.1 aminotransferase class IV [Sinomicrobium weinanense]